MNSTFSVLTDKAEIVKLESRIMSALWVSPVAYGGFEALFKVTTVFVADGSTIVIKGRSSKGKAPGKITGKIIRNCFKGSLLIPEKVSPGAAIWFEAKLPKHGLKMESNAIAARPAIGVKKLCWDRNVVSRNDIVTLTVDFEEGVLDGEEAVFAIYEHDPDACDVRVVSIPAEVKGKRAEIKWLFDYHDDTASIPAGAELSSVKKTYVNPQYYFVVEANGVRAGEKRESGLMVFKDSITITVQHGNSTLVEDQEYTISLADGSEVKKKADTNRQILITTASPGPFSILHKGQQGHECITGKTGTPLLAIFPDTSLIIDAHMHIQSNNCCPLPLQWAIVAENAGFLMGRPSGDNRKKLNDTTAGWLGSIFAGRLGKIGRLSTDMISQLYRERLYNTDMNQELCWTILSDKELDKYKDEPDEMRIIAGKKAKLSNLSAVSADKYEEKFAEKTRYYFESNRIHRMSIALCMDLSFSHYWGRFGLPLYLSTGSSMLYINDFASVVLSQWKESNTLFVRLEESVVTPEIDISPQYGKACPSDESHSRIHLFPNFTLEESTPLGFSSSFYPEQLDLFTYKTRTTNAPPIIRFEHAPRVRELVSRKYVHFVDHAPGEDTARFEDYAVQRERSIAAAIMSPLSLFTFYHYDPRRHCLSAALSVETVAKNIVAYHAFFTMMQNDKYCTAYDNVHYSGCVEAAEQTTLNNPASLASLLDEHLRTNDAALGELHLYNPAGPGMFWGVKMYPRLGYSPSDFVCYPHLREFYGACESKGIPITAHCGPGGMSISDYFLYERYDEGRYLDIREKCGSYSLKHAAERFDGVVAGTRGQDSPARWEEVLQKYPKLKLNLAHFGSSDTWKTCAGFGKMDRDLSGDTDSGKKYKKHHLYRDWTKKIAELVQNDRYENVYTDISFFVNNDPSWFFGAGHDRDDVAEDMVYLLKKYPSLKDRILMGSDWYMIEKAGEEGIGDYLRKMFCMLRTVSKGVGYDAWHQFSLVNPLRFLGLIEEKKGSEGPFTVDTDKFEGLRRKFEERLGMDMWKKKNGCTIVDTDFKKSFDEMLTLLKNITIPSGYKILRNNQLAILQSDKNDKKGE